MSTLVWTKEERKQMQRIVVKTIHYFCYGRNNAWRYSFQAKDIFRINPELRMAPQTFGRLFLMPLVNQNIIMTNGNEYHRYFINFKEDELEQMLEKIE